MPTAQSRYAYHDMRGRQAGRPPRSHTRKRSAERPGGPSCLPSRFALAGARQRDHISRGREECGHGAQSYMCIILASAGTLLGAGDCNHADRDRGRLRRWLPGRAWSALISSPASISPPWSSSQLALETLLAPRPAPVSRRHPGGMLAALCDSILLAWLAALLFLARMSVGQAAQRHGADDARLARAS